MQVFPHLLVRNFAGVDVFERVLLMSCLKKRRPRVENLFQGKNVKTWRASKCFESLICSHGPTQEVCKVILMPRSLLVFSNEAYTEMSHSIEPEEFDRIQGAANEAYLSCEGGRKVLPRGERSSLTVCKPSLISVFTRRPLRGVLDLSCLDH